MYLENFREALIREFSGSLFRVRDAGKAHPRAEEYLYRLSKSGVVRRVGWGWYYITAECYKDPWDFLAIDRGFKVVIEQTAASIWNYDFIHRDVYR